jgi:hypothetical protein
MLKGRRKARRPCLIRADEDHAFVSSMCGLRGLSNPLEGLPFPTHEGAAQCKKRGSAAGTCFPIKR